MKLDAKHIFNNKIYIAILLFPYLNPNSLMFIPQTLILYQVIQVWKLISILLTLLLVICKKNKPRVFKRLSLIFLSLLLATIINDNLKNDLLTYVLLGFGFSSLVYLALCYNIKKFIFVYSDLLFILGLINLISILTNPSGISSASLYTNTANPMYFLGIDNGLIRILLPSLFCSYLRIYWNDRRLKDCIYPILTIVLVGISLICANTATGILCFVLFNLFALLFLIKKTFFLAKESIIIYIFLFVSLVLLETNFSLITYIALLLGRSGFFTGRTDLWSLSLIHIKDSILWGYGYKGLTLSIWGGFFSSHNMFLEMMLDGGIIYTTFFALTLFTPFFTKNSRLVRSEISIFTLITLYCYLLCGLMEVGVSYQVFGLLTIAYEQMCKKTEMA